MYMNVYFSSYYRALCTRFCLAWNKMLRSVSNISLTTNLSAICSSRVFLFYPICTFTSCAYSVHYIVLHK